MNKLFLIALLTFACTSTAFAEQTDLFPELKGQFKPAVKAEPATESAAQDETAKSDELKAESSDSTTQDETPAEPIKFDTEAQTAEAIDLGRGKISLAMENVRGTMAYARNYSYCFAEAVVRNDTTQRLDNLTITLTYGNTDTQLKFAGIDKKTQKSQKFMMVGEDCALIKSTPQFEIQTCQLGTLSSKSCQGRFQFIPPQ